MPPNEAMATVRAQVARRFEYGRGAQDVTSTVPVETPVNIVYAPQPYAVMMATPADLEDFVAGFSVTEGVIDSIADIREIVVEREERGVRVIVTLSSDKMRRHLARARNLAGRTGCGVCGVEDLAALPMSVRAQPVKMPVHLSAVQRALADLSAHQELNAKTRAVHAAAWSSHAGEILYVREDVGRHNALDKLVGALLRNGVDPASGFVVITSRCSFEMVEKAAAFGAGAIVAVSAPTQFAIERAEAHRITLLAIARSDAVTCFTDPSAVIDDLLEDTRQCA